jgi:6-phosphogluconolactonase
VTAPANRRSLAFVGGYGSGEAPTITAVTTGPSTLDRIGEFPGIENASFLFATADRLFTTSEVDAGTVIEYRIHHAGTNVELERIAEAETGGAHPCHLALHQSGRWLLAANYGGGSVAVIDVGSGNHALRRVHLSEHHGSGALADRQAGPHAHATCFAPDGVHVIAADLGTDRLYVSRIDADTGELSEVAVVPTDPGAGPRHLLFTAGGEHVVVVNELANTTTSYRWDPTQSTPLVRVDDCSTLPPGAAGGLAADIVLAPSGRHLFVSNRGSDTIATIHLDRKGRLGPGDTTSSGGAWPRGIAVTPDGRALVVANQHDDAIAMLPIGADGASLGPVSERLELPAPSSIAFVPPSGAQ